MMRKITIALLFVLACIPFVGKAQTTIYTENFGTTAVLPTGYTSSNATNGWGPTTGTASSGYTGASGTNNILFNNNGTNGVSHTLTYNNSLSTVGYTGITVLWGARATATFSQAVTFEWSSDGTTWNAVTYTQVTANATWALVNGGTRISLPSGAEGVANLRFRWTSVSNNNGNYKIDDFSVQGTNGVISAQDGPWTTASTWVGGVVPTSSSNVTIAHNVTVGAVTRNSGTTTTITTTGTLKVSGAYSAIGGSTTVNGAFQLDAGGYTVSSTNNFTYGAAGTLVFNNTSSYGVNNTDAYWPTASGPVNVTVLQGGFQLNSANRTISGTLATASGVTLSSSTLTLNGTTQLNSGGYFASTPVFGSASTLVYNTTGTFSVGNEWTGNSTTAGAGVPQNIVILNATTLSMPSGNRGLAGNLNINSGTLALNSGGDLYIGGNWTRSSTATFTPNDKGVFFNGSANQTVTVNPSGTEIFNYLRLTGLSLTLASGTNLEVNRASGLTLSSNMILGSQTLTLSAGGNLDLNAGTRTITSTAGKISITNSALTVTNGGSLTSDANTLIDLRNGLDCGSGSLWTVNGTLQMNAVGYVFGNSPKYGSVSLLQYNNAANPFSRSLEWTSGPATIGTAGYPNNVQVSNNTTLNYINGSNSGAKGINGNLVIDSGSAFYMDYGSVSSGGALTVAGNISIAGSFSLGYSSGDDLKIGGNFVNTGTFVPNARAVFFTKNGTQTVSSSSALTIPYVIFQPASGSTTVQLLSSLSVTAPNTGNAISFSSASDVFDLNGFTLTIGTAGIANAISGSGTFKGSTASNMTLRGSGSVGTLNFTTGAQSLGTLTVTRTSNATGLTLGTNLLVNSLLQLNSGLVDIGGNNLTLGSTATIGNYSATEYVLTNSTGELRKTFTATGSFIFPVGNSGYSPATVNFSAGSFSAAYAGIRVTGTKHPSNIATTDYLSRYWSLTSSGISSPTYSFTGTYLPADIMGTEANSKPGRYDGTDWQDISATSIGSNILTLSGLTTLSAVNQFSAGNPLTNATYYYRSAAAGAWATASNWQVSPDNSTGWVTASTPPTAASAGINIRNGYNITSSGTVNADDILIDAGATLTLASGGAFTLNNGAAAVDMTVNGTLTYAAGTFTQAASSGIAFGAGSTYNHAVSSASLTLPVATWNTTSTCNITGLTITSSITGPTTLAQTFGNLIWNNPGQTSSGYVNVQSSSFAVTGTLTVSNGLLSLANGSGTFSNTINTLVVNGGLFNGVGATATVNLAITNSVTVTSTGSFNVSFGTGTCNLTIGTDLLLSGDAVFTMANSTGPGNVTVGNDVSVSGNALLLMMFAATSTSETMTIGRDLLISGAASQINMKNSTGTGVAVINVGRDFNSSNTSTTNPAVDFGTGTVASNAINITRNFIKSGAGFFQTSSSSLATGFSFNGTGTHTLNYSGANSSYTSYIVRNGGTLLLNSSLTLGSGTGPASYFTVETGATVDFQTNSVIAGNTTDPRFITSSGATLITSSTGGIGGTTAAGSLRSFGSTNTSSGAGVATLATGVNYTFNGITTSPFPTGTFGNPATVNVNANVTSNLTASLIVSTAVNVNNGGTFKLNPTNNNNLSLTNPAAMNIAVGGTFDNGGENQVTGSGAVNVSGTFITQDIDGFVGTNTSIPGITPVLNSGSTVEYGKAGNQAVQGSTAPIYQNITFSNSGTKTLVSNNDVAGTITISGSAIFDADNKSFGVSGTNLTMTGTSKYRLGGSGTKPDAAGTYTLAPTTTIEFYGTSATGIRLGSTPYNYANIIVNGTSVSNNGTATGIKFQSGGTFTVKNGATFKLSNTTGFTGGTATAINNTNSPTVTLETGSTVEYAGAAQSLTPFPPSYYNLAVSGTGTKSISGSSEILVGNNLSVTASTVQIDSNKLLTVTNGISNTSGNDILIANGGNLVQITDVDNATANNNSGNIKMTRTTRSMSQNDYVYWGAPIKQSPISQIPSFYAASYTWMLSGNLDGAWTGAGGIGPGNGFITRVSGAGIGVQNFDFTGLPNNGIVNVAADSYDNGATTSATGNTVLLGNPYPSAISASSLISMNSSLAGTLYFWTSITPITNNAYSYGDYATWNGTGGTAPNDASGSNTLKPTGKIAAGQGFFANLSSDTGVTFSNAMRLRTTADNLQFFRNGNEGSTDGHLWLNLSGQNAFRQMLVGYVEGATNGYDPKFDGQSFSGSKIDLYSTLSDKKLNIQGRGLPFNESDIVPLGIKITVAGTYSIAIDEKDGLMSAQNIFVEDLLLGIIHDLNQSPYEFTSASGTFNDRFLLRYTNETLGTVTPELQNTLQIATGNDKLSLHSSIDNMSSIRIFDLAGRLIFDERAIDSIDFSVKKPVGHQAVIVRVTFENGTVETRKVIL